ncbi:MAG: insulinase family protein [Candidatus Rokubacteria bacterium]|nr:insulinase family protein [Candidatus Rokubacteria bacterium]
MTHHARRALPALLLAALPLAVWLGASAAQSPAPAPSTGAALTAGIRETILPNGLRVLTKEVRSAPVVSFGVWYKVGSRNEHTGITGVSHLLEHMLFKGTKRYRVGEIARTLALNGASFNASTYYDWTNYHETLASDRLELAMVIEADRMVNSRIDKADLDAEMTVVRSELEGGENHPGRLLWRAVAATAFQAHPYRWPVIGWRSDVENVPRQALYRYYKSYYGPNNATVVIVGDFDTTHTLGLVRKHFGTLKAIPTPPPVYTTEPPQRGERRVTVRRAGSLPMVMVAWKGPTAGHPDSYALDVLAMVLGEGRTSRLYQGLVEKQIASRADAGAPSLRDPFLFYVSATGRPGTAADKLEAALLDEVGRVKTAPITADELARAQSRTEADFVFQTDSVSAQARQIGYWAMVADWRYLATYLDRIRALTTGEIQRVAETYLVPEASTVGDFIPAPDGPSAAAPPPREASARVEKPQRGDRPIPLPTPSKVAPVSRHVTRSRLDNGISVVVQANPTNPTFALRLSLPAGSIVEPRDKPGLASLTATMLTYGTEKRTALEFATALENVGASLGASANSLTTMISGHAQSKDFALVMDLLAEMLRQPAFPAGALERVKGQILAGLAREKTDPARLGSRAFERVIYPIGHPLRPATLEEAQRAMTEITRDDVEAFYRQQYGPDRVIVVVAGDVKADQVRDALASRLGSWPRNLQARPLLTPDVPLQAQAETVGIPVPDKSETTILWGHAGGLRRSDPDFYATQVLNLILGGGALTSRLGTRIRDEQGLAYSVYSYFDSNLYPGPFQVSLGTNPANARQAIAGLDAEIRRIRAKGVTRRELDEAVAYLTGRFPLRLETSAGLADILWAMAFYDLGPDYIDRYGDYYRAVTVAQVNEAARRHLAPERATLVLAGTVPADAPSR